MFGKMDHWSVNPSDAKNWYPNKWTLVIQLIKPLSNWLEQPFTQAACTFDYVTVGVGFLSLVFARNSIDIVFHLFFVLISFSYTSRVYGKLIKAKNKWKTIDPSDPSNCKNPVITLGSISHNPSDWKVRNKWFFLAFRSVGSLVSLIQVSKQ